MLFLGGFLWVLCLVGLCFVSSCAVRPLGSPFQRFATGVVFFSLSQVFDLGGLLAAYCVVLPGFWSL